MGARVEPPKRLRTRLKWGRYGTRRHHRSMRPEIEQLAAQGGGFWIAKLEFAKSLAMRVDQSRMIDNINKMRDSRGVRSGAFGRRMAKRKAGADRRRQRA